MKRILIIILVVACQSCHKDILDEKPNSKIVVPSTLTDCLQILDENTITMGSTPNIGELSSDDIIVPNMDYLLTLKPWVRNSYLWAKDIFEGQGAVDDWNITYKQVFNSNVVLETLANIERNEKNRVLYDNIKGYALFYRAFAFFQASQIFSEPFDSLVAGSKLGVPLRLESRIDLASYRSTLKETFERILIDLSDASSLVSTIYEPTFKNRPTKAACLCMLARVYMVKGDFKSCELYSDSALKIYSNLVDYNTLNTAATTPISRANNVEVLYWANMNNNTSLLTYNSRNYYADTTLFSYYSDNDLRRLVFFNYLDNKPYSKIGYTGLSGGFFSGLAVDELYLMNSESKVRNGKVQAGIDALNSLLVKRFKKDKFTPISASNTQEALAIVLKERRKELCFRGLRWIDLKRLNQYDNAGIVLRRSFGLQEYILSPNDKKYTLPIPPDVVSLAGIPQNDR